MMANRPIFIHRLGGHFIGAFERIIYHPSFMLFKMAVSSCFLAETGGLSASNKYYFIELTSKFSKL